MRRLSVLLFLACLALISGSVSLADGYPLFASADTLDLVLEVPIRTLLRQAKKKPVLPGQLRYVDGDGKEVVLDFDMTTRGRSRLAICSFPPLSISLHDDDTDSSLFAGQRKLKIVTHCNKRSDYLTYLHQEYGIYKAYNLLSDFSFRVRKLNVTYRDSDRKRKDDVREAFFIESEHEAAQRLGMESIKRPSIKVRQLNPEETSIYTLFQYLIANTDWSIRKGPRDEDCCHNGKLIGNPGTQDNWVVLAYDFDQAGIINTSYALPAKGLGIKSVRSRLYRGRCLHNDHLAGAISLFNDRREEIEAALVPQSLSRRKRDSTLSYIEKFYSTINDPESLKKEVLDDCLRGS
jgi:hypothetical protein